MIFINKPYLPEDQTALWEMFRESADNACSGNYAIDPEMLPIIQEFNRIEGVTTRYCCEGHPDDLGVDNAYVMLVCDQSGLEKLMRFNMHQAFHWISENEGGQVWRLEHSMAVVVNNRGTEFWYPCVVLRSNDGDNKATTTRYNAFLLQQLQGFNRAKTTEHPEG
ncbi:hypothetical protein AVT69_gp354 [Pseudomonas phage PhiPA3]|uniref:Uncharacterized protein 356 n=1 Tax=Pseudomonas phage PhiPA3 TaxID=998086 RepID=F8SJN1_BPPA3|nr:hypothetical protein AVT69_gp354 [Pseudomonas phage PhiPA3]AEH03779.1 hypothetical protein [Pseudomonas phage PhiPA3]